MTLTALSSGPMTQFSTRLAKQSIPLIAIGLMSIASALMVNQRIFSLAFLTLGFILFAIVGLSRMTVSLHARERHRGFETISQFIAHDATPSFATDDEGAIGYRNAAAETRFPDSDRQTLAGVLTSVFANPGAVLFRLQTKANANGAAREDIVTRKGHIRLSVHQLEGSGFLWRLEDVVERSSGRTSGGQSLPMLTTGRSGAILYMNDAARLLIGERVKSLDRIFPQLPLRPGLINPITSATGPQECLVAQLEGNGGRREIFLLPAPRHAELSVQGEFDDLPVPILKLADSGEIIRANRAAQKLMGGVQSDGKRLSDLMEGLGRSIEDWLADACAGRGLQHSEFLRLKRADREVFVQVTLSLCKDGDDRALVAVLNDATELKTLEAQFVQSQKMQAIGELAGGVAHDFNNLLTAISGHCDLMLLRHDQGDPDYGDLKQINQNANRAAALVGQLLAFSRKQTLRPEVLDLRDTLSDLAHLLNRLVGEKVTLSLNHDPLLKMIRADKRQLEQVLMNLVVNARDAMPSGGEIRIETGVMKLDDAMERDRAVVEPGEYVTVIVEDAGTGIAPDKLQKIFEPFYTTKRTGEGTGLGLSTAYGIVKQSGGFIFVDSEAGEGTKFTLIFPVYDGPLESVAPVEKPAAQSAPSQGDGVVLLVEDEAPVRAFAARALRLRGYTVIEAKSAEEALELLGNKELMIDVFVTDVVMPGMDGPTWVVEALKTRPDAKVVFVSGYAEESFGDTQARIPNSVFLPKPFSLSDLTETVQEQLH